MDPLARYVDELLTPCVMVAASDEVQRMCAKSSLTFGQLLRPCGFLKRIDVPLRIGDRALRLHDLNVRFYDAPQMRQIPTRETEDLLRQILMQNLDRGRIPGARSPWYREYLGQLNRCCLFSNQYMFDLPTCILLVLPSSYEGNVVEGFQQLWSQTYATLPDWLKSDEADLAHVTRVYVLLHDASSPEPVHGIETKLQQMQRAYQPGHHQFLTINSLPLALEVLAQASDAEHAAQSAKPPGGFWACLVNPRAPGGGAGEPGGGSDPPESALGSLITGSDLEALKSFVERVVVRCVLPELEARARSVHQHVTNTRRGLKNQIRSLWFKSLGGAGEDDGSVKCYGLSSQEGQMHWLADLALMLRDFEVAISTYKILADDYKNERAWRHLAATHESLALAQALSDQPLRDVEASFLNALQAYQQAGAGPGTHLMAARCGILMAEYYRTADRKRESISAFLRVAQDPSAIRAALMLEQVAYGYLDIGMARRFVFHMVLAGHKAMEGSIGLLAGYLYQGASQGGKYPGASWSFIDEHVQGILARFSEGEGDARAFIGHVQQLLRCSHQPTHVQLQELRTLEQAVRIAIPEAYLPDLWLPEVTATSAAVSFDDFRCLRTSGEQEESAESWFAHEDALITVPGVSASAIFDLAAKTTVNGHPAHLCVAGEVVSCTVTFTNPLAIPILIERAKLVCEFEADGDTAPAPSAPMPRSAPTSTADFLRLDAGGEVTTTAPGTPGASDPFEPVSPRSPPHAKSFSADVRAAEGDAAAPSTTGRPHDRASEQPSGPAAAPYGADDAVELLEETLSLKGGERTVLTLRIRPRVAGTFRILGVEWRLQGAVKGRKLFDFKDAPRRKGVLPSRMVMRFKVIPPMPRLEARLLHVPEVLYAGEVRRCEWELVNSGRGALRGLRVASMLEDVLLGATAVVIPGGKLAAAVGDKAPFEVGIAQSKRPGVYTFPVGLVLEPGDQLRCSMWVHPAREGLFQQRVSWYFEALEPHKRMKGRFLHYSHVLPVLPALHLETHASQSAHEIGSVLLDLSLQNAHRLDAITVTHVRAPDASWNVTDLNRLLDRASEVGSGASSGTSSRADGAAMTPAARTPGPKQPRMPKPKPGLELRPEANGLMYFLLQPSATARLATGHELDDDSRVLLRKVNGGSTAALDDADPFSPLRSSLQQASGAATTPRTPAALPDPLSAVEDYDAAEEWAVRRFFRRHAMGGQSKIFAGSSALTSAQQQQRRRSSEGAGPSAAAGGASSSSSRKTPGPGKARAREDARPKDPPLFLAVHWQISSRLERGVRAGVHFLGPVNIAGRSVVQLQTPAALTVTHDFTAAAPCFVRVPVGVFNTCAAPIDVELDVTGPAKEIARGLPAGAASPWTEALGAPAPAAPSAAPWGPGLVEPYQPFHWLGVRRRLVRALPGREMATFVLHVAIHSPGEHQLSGYSVNFRGPAENSLGVVKGEAITVKVLGLTPPDPAGSTASASHRQP